MMTKRDRWYAKACPWFFGAVCIVGSLALIGKKDLGVERAVYMCGGFICLSLFGVCALLVDLIETMKSDQATDTTAK